MDRRPVMYFHDVVLVSVTAALLCFAIVVENNHPLLAAAAPPPPPPEQECSYKPVCPSDYSSLKSVPGGKRRELKEEEDFAARNGGNDDGDKIAQRENAERQGREKRRGNADFSSGMQPQPPTNRGLPPISIVRQDRLSAEFLVRNNSTWFAAAAEAFSDSVVANVETESDLLTIRLFPGRVLAVFPTNKFGSEKYCIIMERGASMSTQASASAVVRTHARFENDVAVSKIIGAELPCCCHDPSPDNSCRGSFTIQIHAESSSPADSNLVLAYCFQLYPSLASLSPPARPVLQQRVQRSADGSG